MPSFLGIASLHLQKFLLCIVLFTGAMAWGQVHQRPARLIPAADSPPRCLSAAQAT